MKQNENRPEASLAALLARYPKLESCAEQIEATASRLMEAFAAGHKLLLCGNGGSAADCEHITGELLKGFLLDRPLPETTRRAMQSRCPALLPEDFENLQMGLPAVSLCGMTSLSTAFANDVAPEYVFAQGVLALGRAGDGLLCISTSGNSKNVVHAAKTARGCGLFVLSLTGSGGGKLAALSDVCIAVPETETFLVQELHLPVYHFLCAAVERKLFGEGDDRKAVRV